LALSEQHVSKILEYCLEERAIADIMALFNRRNRTKFKEKFINPLLEEDFLTATSSKSKSSKQTYITTSKGKDILESQPPDQITDPGTKSGLSWDQVGTKLGLSWDYVAKMLEYCLEERAIADIMAFFNRKNKTKFRKTFINPLIEEDFLTMKIPGKPRSAKQKYVISEKGKNLLKKSADIFKRPSSDKDHPKEYEVEQLEIEPVEAPRKYPASIQQALNKFGWTWDKFNDFVLSLSQVCPRSVPSEIAAVILMSTQEEMNIMDLMKIADKTNRTRFRKFFLEPLIEAGLMVFTIPGKPKSSKQKYVITEKGKKLLKKYQD
jgi:predicted transcriptional regulator